MAMQGLQPGSRRKDRTVTSGGHARTQGSAQPAFRCHEFTAVEMQPGAGGANLELGEGVPTGTVVAGGEGVGVEGVFREEGVR